MNHHQHNKKNRYDSKYNLILVLLIYHYYHSNNKITGLHVVAYK